MKKLSLFLSIVLILIALTPAVSAVDENLLEISGASVDAEAGDLVQIPVTITTNPGFMGLALYYVLPYFIAIC